MTNSECSTHEIDIHDPELLKCPHEFYRRLLAEASVVRDAKSGIFQVSSYDLVRNVLADPVTYSSCIRPLLHGKNAGSQKVAEIMAQGFPRPDTLQTSDPPVHTRSRKLVNKAFTPRRVEVMEPDIRAVANELVDTFAANGRVEFVSEFAHQLPMIVIAKQLGVPLSDMEKFKAWSDAFKAQFSHTTTEDEEVAIALRVVAFQKYFADVLEQKRNAPTDDIISDIATADLSEEGDSRRLDTPEALQIIQQLLVAGNETTESSLSQGMYLLIKKPEVLGRSLADTTLLARAVEEIIRISSSVQAMWRITTIDTELGGVQIPAGSSVLVRFAAANLDETMFAKGEELDLDRLRLRRHVAFGHGIHACIGAPLARKEIAVAFRTLFTRLKGWRLTEDSEEPPYVGGMLLRGIEKLNLEFDPAPL